MDNYLIAKNFNTPVDVLIKLSTDKDSNVRRGVARNPNTPIDILEKLSSDKESDVRGGVAQNLNTPVDILVQLSTDEDSWVRMYVAQNRHTPVDVLVKLSTDGDSWVRRYVARNPNTPVDILVQLSTDKNSDVQKGVAQNPNTPVDILEKLSTNAVFENPEYTNQDERIIPLNSSKNELPKKPSNSILNEISKKLSGLVNSQENKKPNIFNPINSPQYISNSIQSLKDYLPKTNFKKRLNETSTGSIIDKKNIKTLDNNAEEEKNTEIKNIHNISSNFIDTIKKQFKNISNIFRRDDFDQEIKTGTEEQKQNQNPVSNPVSIQGQVQKQDSDLIPGNEQDYEKSGSGTETGKEEQKQNQNPVSNPVSIQGQKQNPVSDLVPGNKQDYVKSGSGTETGTKPENETGEISPENKLNNVENSILNKFKKILLNNTIPLVTLASQFIIKNYRKSSEKSNSDESDESDEKSKEKKKKKSIFNETIDNIKDKSTDFVFDLAFFVVQYSALLWFSDPKNKDSVLSIIKFLKNLFDFTVAIVGFGINNIMDGLYNIIEGSKIEKIFGFLQVLVGALALRYILNPRALFTDIQYFLKNKSAIKRNTQIFFRKLNEGVIPAIRYIIEKLFPQSRKIFDNILIRIIKKITKNIGKFIAGKIGKTAINLFKTQVKAVSSGIKGIPVIGTLLGIAIDLALGDPIEKALFKAAAGLLGRFVGGLLGAVGGPIGIAVGQQAGYFLFDFLADMAFDNFFKKPEDEKPVEMATGGIVTKPTRAIIGEDGPEAVIPLKEFRTDGIIGTKIIEPFKIVGSSVLGTMFDVMTGFGTLGISIVPLLKTILAPSVKIFGIKSAPTLEIQKNKETINKKNIKIENKKDNSEEKKIIGEETISILENDDSDENYIARKNKGGSLRSLLGDILNNIIQLDFNQINPIIDNNNSNAPSFTNVGPYREILELISSVESRAHGYYDAYNQGGSDYGTVAENPGNSSIQKIPGIDGFGGTLQNTSRGIVPITERTVEDIMRMQNAGYYEPGYIKYGNYDSILHATGRYQIIGTTLQGLMRGDYGPTGVNKTDKYNAETQDKLAIALVNNRIKEAEYLGNKKNDILQSFRNEWRGLEHVDNETLYNAVTNLKKQLKGGNPQPNNKPNPKGGSNPQLNNKPNPKGGSNLQSNGTRSGTNPGDVLNASSKSPLPTIAKIPSKSPATPNLLSTLSATPNPPTIANNKSLYSQNKSDEISEILNTQYQKTETKPRINTYIVQMPIYNYTTNNINRYYNLSIDTKKKLSPIYSV